MSIKKNITIDGMEVPFKASAAVPRLYRLKFRRDIYKDFASLKTDVEEGDENKSELDIESLEVFENIAYIIRTQEKLAVLGDAYQRLADADVVPFFHQQILHITADGRNNSLAACRMVLCDCLVTDTGIFVNLFGLR